MRLGITSQNPLEFALLRLGIVPKPLLLGYWGMSVSRCMLTGVRLGVFDALASGPKTAEELASELKCDRDGMEVLLASLNGMRYVRRRSGAYVNSRQAQRWIVRSSRFSMADTLLFYDDIWDTLGTMTEGVRTGEMGNFHYEGRPAEFWQHYLNGLASFARLAGPSLARSTGVPRDSRRLLDVGGGHGLYAAAYARRFPDLTVEVLDLPEACEQGRRIVAEEGLADRITFREGDARLVEWDTDYDVVLLFNLIHNLTREEAADCIRKAYDALRTGGRVIILEGEHAASGGDLSLTAGLNELLFYLMSGTRTYPEETLRSWISSAGFGNVRTRRMAILPMTAILTAERP